MHIVVFVVVVMFTNMGQMEMETTDMCSQHVEYVLCTLHPISAVSNLTSCCAYPIGMYVYDMDNTTSGVEDGSQWGRRRKSLESSPALKPTLTGLLDILYYRD